MLRHSKLRTSAFSKAKKFYLSFYVLRLSFPSIIIKEVSYIITFFMNEREILYLLTIISNDFALIPCHIDLST